LLILRICIKLKLSSKVHKMTDRKFVRHPTSIPVDYQIGIGMEQFRNPLNDIAFGGLSIQTSHDIPQNHEIILNFTQFKPVYTISGRVAWCRQSEDKYEVGIEFTNSDEAFRVRMVEQVCHIEEYRMNYEKNTGGKMSSEKAAVEWIEKYSDKFPNIQN